MAAFSSAAFSVAAFSVDAFDFGSSPTPTVEAPSGGGRRIYDPDDKKRRKRYEPLSKRERAELERAFKANAKPRYVAPAAESPTKRTAPLRITPMPVEPEPATRPAERIQAAKQFMALDAVESALDSLEVPADAPMAVRRAHAKARANAIRLAQIQERLAAEHAKARAAEQQRLAAEQAERDRIAAELEQERLRLEAEENEMVAVLRAFHEGMT